MARSPLSVVKFLKVFIAWWLVWGGLQAALLWWLGVDAKIACVDSVVFNGLAAVACLLLCHIMQYYLPQQERYLYILFVSISFSTAIAFTARWILKSLYEEEPEYLQLLKNSFPVRYAIAFLLIVCMAMICALWYGFQEQQEIGKRKSAAEALNREAELFALRRQLQPHFLFNSLNSISALVASRPQEARNMIQQLSDFLRGTIKKDDNQFVSLQDELQHLQLYLSIEQVRFGHRLQTEIATDDEATAMKMPALLLQPIVENAIKFGLYDTIGAVKISIQSRTLQNELEITVANPYEASITELPKGEGFGLSSVQRRLYLLYARNDLLTTKTDDNLFITTIKIPQLDI